MIDFDRLATAANDDAEFRLAARYWNSRLAIEIDGIEVELLLIDGRVIGVGAPGTFGGELRRVRIAASASDWTKVLDPFPAAGWHNFALAPGFSYTGNILDRSAYHAALRRLVALMRAQLHGTPDPAAAVELGPGTEDMVGRYLRVTIQEVEYRIYYEETGSGIPLLMQHTAAANGSQWRHILGDRSYQQHYRLIAYDLPFHGKSLPPTGRAWWADEYRPNRQWAVGAVRAISHALGLERPVFMGCSIGGMLAPVLALEHPDEFRAVIGINAGLRFDYPQSPLAIDTADDAIAIQPRTWFHPRVANDWRGAAMLDMMSPGSPPAFQRETAWLYDSSGPAIFVGDGDLYADLVLDESEARRIDTSRVEVVLMTGEYDPVAMTGAADRLAACIDGSTHILIKDGGHFAPSDNPHSFKRSLDPVLERIAATPAAIAATP